MLRIDAHQHFWQYEPVRDSWINESMEVIRKDFMPGDLLPLLQTNQVAGCVAIQADQSEKETEFLLDLALKHSYIKGIVGWTDLCHVRVEERLAYYSRFKAIKGFRHILQAEEPAFMLQEQFKNGISLLHKYGFTYDVLIYAHQLKQAAQLVAAFPDQPFVVDHIAKPAIRQGEIIEWTKGIKMLAQYPNVHCKISGMVTEADWHQWKEPELRPYLDTVVEAFGIERVMYGSDWPVCLLAADYTTNMSIARNYFSGFSQEEQAMFFGKNATAFYQLV